MSKKLKFFAMMLTCILLSINQLWGVDYNLVTNVSQLAAGDIVVISTSGGTTATTVENTNGKKDAYWYGYVASTGSVASGKLTALGTNTAEYTLSKSGDNWVLTCASGYVGSVSEKKLQYDKGTNTWTIAVNTTNYRATISSTTGNGSIQFNSDRFRTYTSSQTAVYLFKKETGSTKTLTLTDPVSSHSGAGSVSANATSFSYTTTPSYTGYKVEGFYASYASSTFSTKVANGDRSFVANVSNWTGEGGAYTKGSDATLYIKWQAKQAAITFDKNDGTGGDNGTTATYGSAMPTVTVPTRTGYDFDGYYDAETDDNGSGNKYYNSDGTSAANWNKDTEAATTLYAKWTVKTLNITWSVNGNSWSEGTPSPSVTYGSKIATFPTSPAAGQCDGSKEFVGWTLTPIVGTTNTKPTFVSPQTTITETGNFTLYAVFATRATNSYTRGNVNDLINGKEVLITNYNATYALSNTVMETNKKLTPVSVSPSEGVITSMSNTALIWTVYNTTEAKYYFKIGDNYLWAVGSSNQQLSYGSTADAWTIAETGSGTNLYYMHSANSTSSMRLEYYKPSGDPFFTTYTSNTTDAFKMQFYVPTYSAYATTCSTEPRLNVTPTSLDFGNVANGTYKEMTFSLSGTNLAENASVAVSGKNSSYFTVSKSSVDKGTGTIAATEITVRYTPGAVGDGHTAKVTVTSGEAEEKTVTLTGNSKATYSVSVSPTPSNGTVIADKTSGIMAGETVTLTVTPSSGYQLASINAVDGSSNTVTLSGSGNTRTFTMPESDVTISATFSVRTDYVLVESALDDYSGEYLIVYHSAFDNFYALSGRYGNKNANTYGTYTDVTEYYDAEAKAIISNATTDAMKMVIEPGNISGRYTIYFYSDNTYLAMTTGNKSTGAYLRFNESITSGYEYDWDLSWNTTYSVSEVAIHNNAPEEGNKKWLWLLYNTTDPRFALYTSGADIELYKKTETCERLAAPTGLSAGSLTQTTATLSWTAVANASGYEVSLDNGSSWTSTGTNTSYDATSLTQGTTYNWKVRATGDGSTYCAKGSAASSSFTTKRAVKVTYTTNGATGGTLPVSGGVVNLTEGDSHTVLGNTGSGGSPTPLTKTGYTWAGWHSSATYSATPAYTVGEPITVTENITLYANWRPQQDTFFDDMHQTSGYTGAGHTESGSYTMPGPLSNVASGNACETSHYIFVGWVIAGGQNPDGTINGSPKIWRAGESNNASGATYYAVWAEE